ncbi:MAG TPA: MBL fold metallo-hydrolase [Baekduia sp.]|jgi:ribonuclease BN (tRNA processing enzyme)
MRFDVLGFAGAAPLQGACSSYVVSSKDTTLLLDCGPGTLERLWQRELLGRIDAIVLSHMHADHVLDLVPFSGEVVRRELDGRRIPLHVPAANGRDVLRRLDAAFAGESREQTRFAAAFAVSSYDPADRLRVGDLRVTFAPADHGAPCCAIRVANGERSLVYGADGGPSDVVAELAAGTDLLVLEATFADDVAAAAAHGHMTAGQAGEVAAAAKAKRLLLTHLLARTDGAELAQHAGGAFDGPIDLAHEGWTTEL